MTKKIPNGKGWFIWQIKRVYGGDLVQIAKAAKAQNVSWVSIKICDRSSGYNFRPILSVLGAVIGWKDDIIQPLVDALRAEGIAVYGWGYAYLDYGWLVSPAKEAAIAVTRVKQFGLDGFFIDAEGQAENHFANAQAYIQALRSGLPDIAIGLCSFRFPSVQTDFPWLALLAGCDFHAPQVYWIQADNAADQLTRSFNELTGMVNLPFVPLGIAAKDDNSTWKPTAAQIQAFTERAHNMGIQAVGWYEWGDAQVAGLEGIVAMQPGVGDAVDPLPAPDPAPVPVPVSQDVDMIVRVRTHHSNLVMEPATVPVAFTAKEAKQVVTLNQAWQDYILAINGGNKDIFARIADPMWGPTTGIQDGRMFLIALAYWLQKVRKLETVIGADGKPWGRIACLGVNDGPPDPTQVNFQKTPWLVHHVTMQNTTNQLVGTGKFNTDNAYVPLVALQANQMFLPMALLSQVAVVSAWPAVNVRKAPSTSATIVDRIIQNDGAVINQVQLGEGGVWAQGVEGWFALRYNGVLLSDWRV